MVSETDSLSNAAGKAARVRKISAEYNSLIIELQRQGEAKQPHIVRHALHREIAPQLCPHPAEQPRIDGCRYKGAVAVKGLKPVLLGLMFPVGNFHTINSVDLDIVPVEQG